MQDTVIKREIYARAGLPEYWIFNPSERTVLVLSDPNPANGNYRQVRPIPCEGELVASSLPFRAAIAPFFAGSPDETL